MERCWKCKGKCGATTAPDEVIVDGMTFRADIPAIRCGDCGEIIYPGPALEAFELGVARALVARGISSGPALKFVRKAMGLRAVDLAELLGVAAETISRWETGERAPDRNALALLGALVEDRIEGRTTTVDRLPAIDKPARSPKGPVRIEVAVRPRARTA